MPHSTAKKECRKLHARSMGARVEQRPYSSDKVRAESDRARDWVDAEEAEQRVAESRSQTLLRKAWQPSPQALAVSRLRAMRMQRPERSKRPQAAQRWRAPAVVVGVAAGAEEETRVGADIRRWDTLVLLVLDCHQVA